MANKISQTSSDRSPPLYAQYALEVLEGSIKSPYTKYPFVDKKSQLVNIALVGGPSVAAAINEAKQVLARNSKQGFLQFFRNKQLVVAQDGGMSYTVGDLAKPSKEKIEFGYLAEGVLQCAIAARLVERTKNITPAMVADYVRDYLNSPNEWQMGSKTTTVARRMEYEADNQSINGKDLVISYVALNSKAFSFLKNRANVLHEDIYLKSFFQDAAKYVNSGAPAQHARYFYMNGLVDKLEVKSLGVIGQGKTKADIITEYYQGYDPRRPQSGTPIPFKLNISVKINNEEQFGQATGIYAEAMERFAAAVGVTLSSTTKQEIQKLVPTSLFGGKPRPTASPEDIKSSKTHTKVYKLVYEDIMEQLNTQRGKIESFFDGIENFISFKDPSIVIVNVGGGDAVYYADRFNDLKKRLKDNIINVKLVAQPSGNYQMDFFIAPLTKSVLRLESRPIGPTFRNYVKSGEQLRTWLSEI